MTSRGVAAAVAGRGASPSRRCRPCAITDREDHRHADERDRRRPAEADGDLGADHVQLADEEAERRQAEQRDEAEAEDAAEHGTS